MVVLNALLLFVVSSRCEKWGRRSTVGPGFSHHVALARYAYLQVTRGFQSLNMPLGLCFQIHA
jgi:hypothetical protein